MMLVMEGAGFCGFPYHHQRSYAPLPLCAAPRMPGRRVHHFPAAVHPVMVVERRDGVLWPSRLPSTLIEWLERSAAEAQCMY